MRFVLLCPSRCPAQSIEFYTRFEMLYIDLSPIPAYSGTAWKPGWTNTQQLYENIHPNHALVQLKLDVAKVYWRDRVGGLAILNSLERL